MAVQMLLDTPGHLALPVRTGRDPEGLPGPPASIR